MKKISLILILFILSVYYVEQLNAFEILDTTADVLIVEYTYDGPVERVGKLKDMRYTATYLFVEFYNNQGDGIFRNGFEESH